jgi:signal transduction histidine kinase
MQVWGVRKIWDHFKVMTEDLYPSFAALLAAALFVPSFTLAIFALTHKETPFWRYCSAGMLLVFVASALNAMRDVTSIPLSLIISNLFVGAGYYLNLKAVLIIYQITNWKRLDEASLIIYFAAVIIVNIFFNSYENRVLVVSAGIVFFSLLIGISGYRCDVRNMALGSLALIIFAISNIIFVGCRFLSAIPLTDEWFLISVWDPVFFIWSIAATFLFSFAQFINGNAIIQQKNLQLMQEAKRRLEHEKELSSQLAMANEEQQNLQKLLLHEFKRPLAAIQAALQAQSSKDAVLDQSKASHLNALTAQATEYLEGISQYHDVAELFAEPNWSHLPVAQIAHDITTKWGVEVSVEAELGHQEVRCDPLLVDIAISNLIENAKKFGSGTQGVSVNIGSVGGNVQIDVRDDGPGIPNAEWRKVWRKFYKLDDETPTALTGCGLGLYVVAQVAQTHEGTAYVVSEKPSVIRLELPLARIDGADG